MLEYGTGTVPVAQPRLTWRLGAGVDDWLQAAYEVELKLSSDQPVSTGRIPGADSVFVPWPFAPLASGEKGAVRVRAHAADGRSTAWSDPVEFSVGLLCRADWTGQFISPYDSSGFRGAHHLRRRFHVTGHVRRAVLHMSALGVFTPFLNGSSVGDHVLDPGWTSYGHRICSSSFDVTDLVVEGDNVLAVLVADGWYRGRLGYGRGTKYDVYGARVAILGQLEIDTDDNPLRVVTDTKWRAAQGPILASSIYDGETWDFRADLPGWTRATYDDSAWNAVESVLVSPSVEPMPMAPVRRTGARRPDVVSRSDSSILLDFGQNLVGWIRFEATGRAGDEIVVRHAEVLQDGALCVYPLRTAKATDTFILAGRERREVRAVLHVPRLSIRGIERRCRLDRSRQRRGRRHPLGPERTGWFESSDPDLDRLHENVVWSMRGNFVSLPTDCPQRDERMGWTGDIQVFAPTACFVYDVGGFLSSWLTDLALEQRRMVRCQTSFQTFTSEVPA